ncbi:Uncharacterized protein TPAR_07024 [Tolypocladium paradoxum]|uniref:Cytochrome b2, mitochondrial n=1 Tax=Tolypocladium paradoxum TaxID=94208 RepID=A0A2S4KRF6_9HYPO|nr:Uncharacterized protein TPAR_07024 [Tolypocladium paradoxum]
MDAAEVARHNTPESCWIVIHGQVWDVTESVVIDVPTGFLGEHPGGAKIIFKYAGQDATEAYDGIHNPDLVHETLSASQCLGAVDMTTLGNGEDTKKETAPKSKFPPLGAMINADDFEKVAETYLTEAGWAYYSSGAEDELSIQEARRVFQKLTLRPRILRDVENIDTRTQILGLPTSLPIYISPTGSAKYAHPDSEPLIVSAAGKEGLIYCMPSLPSATLESIFKARVNESQPLFRQLYINRDHEKAKAQIREAESLGAKAIFVTVDSPVIGKRERDERLTAGDDDPFAPSAGGVARTGSAKILNAALTWRDLEWIRENTTLPLVLKGVQSVEDAVLAYKYGLQGIVLSNHGGRSQDTAQAPMLTLLEIRKYAPQLLSTETRQQFQVLLDGNVRRGTDVLKALALGAAAVGIGRPVLYSMTAGYGERGIRRLVQILRAGLETNMALAGATTVNDLVPEMVNSERVERMVTTRPKL